MVADLDTFHVLPADIQDTVNIWIKESSCIIMGNSFYFTFIQDQGCLNKCFTITGGAGVGNVCILWQKRINLLDRADGCF